MGEGAPAEYTRRRREADTAVGATDTMRPDGGDYRVLVPLANPDHVQDLIELASVIAKQRGGTVDAVHIVAVPDQMALDLAVERVDELAPGSNEFLEHAREHAEQFGVRVETRRIFSHYEFKQIFDTARTHDADLVVMGWGERGGARAEPRVAELTGDPPCDFLALYDRGFDPERILVSTAGGPDSDLSAEVARHLEHEYDSEVTLLHVADDCRSGQQFLREWAAERDLEDATLRVETGDVETAIENAARNATMVIIGATERGMLARLLTDSVVVEVVDEIDCSVLLAERPSGRSLRDRLFGRR